MQLANEREPTLRGYEAVREALRGRQRRRGANRCLPVIVGAALVAALARFMRSRSVPERGPD